MKRYSIVGQKFRGLDPYLAGTHAGVEAILAREPTNKFDPNAVAVFVDGVHVGYLPAKENGPVAEMIDRTGETRMLPAPGGPAGAKADDVALVATKSLAVKFVRSANSAYPQVEV